MKNLVHDLKARLKNRNHLNNNIDKDVDTGK